MKKTIKIQLTPGVGEFGPKGYLVQSKAPSFVVSKSTTTKKTKKKKLLTHQKHILLSPKVKINFQPSLDCTITAINKKNYIVILLSIKNQYI